MRRPRNEHQQVVWKSDRVNPQTDLRILVRAAVETRCKGMSGHCNMLHCNMLLFACEWSDAFIL